MSNNPDKNEKIIMFLLKFGKRKDLEDFQKNGNMHMNEIRFFEKKEKENTSSRFDENENTSFCIQPDRILLKIDGEEIKDIASPILTKNGKNRYNYIFCMTSFDEEYFSKEPKRVYDPRSKQDFGEYCLLIGNMAEFKKRLILALENVKNTGEIVDYEINSVEYVDKNTYHGEMGCFKKFSKYAWQREHRIAIKVVNHRNKSYSLNIGNIEEISKIIKVEDCINEIKYFENGKSEILLGKLK